MAFELIGAEITDILEVNSGTSKKGTAWKSVEFVCQTTEQYNNLYCFKIFQGENNSKVDVFLEDFKNGDVVDVSFNVNTNKWQRDESSPVKYFVGLDVYKVNKSAANHDPFAAAAADPNFVSDDSIGDELPF